MREANTAALGVRRRRGRPGQPAPLFGVSGAASGRSGARHCPRSLTFAPMRAGGEGTQSNLKESPRLLPPCSNPSASPGRKQWPQRPRGGDVTRHLHSRLGCRRSADPARRCSRPMRAVRGRASPRRLSTIAPGAVGSEGTRCTLRPLASQPLALQSFRHCHCSTTGNSWRAEHRNANQPRSTRRPTRSREDGGSRSGCEFAGVRHRRARARHEGIGTREQFSERVAP